MNCCCTGSKLRLLLLTTGALLSVVSHAPFALAQPSSAMMTFDIEPGPLDQALKSYAERLHGQMLYDARLVAGRQTLGVKGQYTAKAALQRLLAGTDIQADAPTANTIVLRPREAAVTATRPQAAAPSPRSASTRLSRPGVESPHLSAGAAGRGAPGVPSSAATVAEVVVTGTHLRGVTDSPSPVLVVSRDDMDRRGYGTLTEALQALPQNFGGSGNPQSLYAGMDASNSNTLAATGVNLRGLGSDATLVLVNGRRLAGTGAFGDFADISTLPTAAIDRVEVLTDGASAIYGADAVGGVVNVIMRKDFDGAETRVRFGGTTWGPYNDTQVGQTFGRTWSGGSALITYEYDLQTALPDDGRAYAANADLVPLGGTDHRFIYSHPGNLLTLDPTTGAYVPAFAIPSGQDGVGLTSADLIPGASNLQNQRADTDILPRQERQSVYASVQQQLSSRLSLSADLRYGWRRFNVEGGDEPTILSVTSANPYFVAPPGGGTSDLVGYDLADDTGPTRTTGLAQSVGTTGGADLKLFGDWRLSAYGAYAAEFGSSRDFNLLNSTNLEEALGATTDDPSTSFSTAVDGFFNPFGAGHDNSQAVDRFVAAGYDTNHQASQVETADAQVDGSLFHLPGGPVKLAAGFQFRHESFSEGGTTFYYGTNPIPQDAIDVGRNVTAGFLELNLPIVGTANARPALQRLDISLAGRVEDYSDVGTTTNPKIGLIWAPLKDLSFHTSYGTSFRAPALAEVDAEATYNPSILPKGSEQILSLVLNGGNPALRPETADSWSAGAAYSPKFLPDLHLNVTWFRTRFANQIGQPAQANILTVLSDPTLSSFVTLIDPSHNAADLAKITALLNASASRAMGQFPATAYGAIVEAGYANSSALLVSGLDFTVDYTLRRGANRFDIDADGSYLLQYDRKLTPTSPSVELVDTANYPVDFRGRLAGTWTRGVFSGTVDINYLDGERDPPAPRIGSWTTVGLQAAFHSAAQSGEMKGIVLALNVSNVLDTDPPFYDSPEGVGYDATNTSAIGRTVSVQLTKRW